MKVDKASARDQSETSDQGGEHRLIVRNLPFAATSDEIENDLRVLVQVKSVQVPLQPDGKNKGFAFLTFETSDDLHKGQAKLHRQQLLGRQIRVDFAHKDYFNENTAVPTTLPKDFGPGGKYQYAAHVIGRWLASQGGLTSLVFHSGIPFPKRVMALAAETLKYIKIIDEVIKRVKTEVVDGDANLLRALVYDAVFGGNKLEGDGPLHQWVTQNQTALKKALDTIKKEKQTASNEELLPEYLRPTRSNVPRYARVNTLRTTIPRIKEILEGEGFTFIDDGQKHPQPDDHTVIVDAEVPGLLAFGPTVRLHDHPLIQAGHLIIQDKASCLPSVVLDPKPKWTVIDGCAAPGNKTTHLAALMRINKGYGALHAFERDMSRCKRLREHLHTTGAAKVQTHNIDFTKTDPNDPKWAKVKAILLDPSCSGSGNAESSLDQLLAQHIFDKPITQDDSLQQAKVEGLATFQLRILQHAMAFPNVEKIVYSTCSITEQENEGVVAAALKSDLGAKFELVHILPEWQRRGFPLFDGAEHCVRCLPEDDTHGFFLCMLQKKGTATKQANPTQQASPKKRKVDEIPTSTHTSTPTIPIPSPSPSPLASAALAPSAPIWSSTAKTLKRKVVGKRRVLKTKATALHQTAFSIANKMEFMIWQFSP